MNWTNLPRIPAPAGFYGCTSCRTIKPVSEFPTRGGSRAGVYSRCYECKRAYKVKSAKPLAPKFYAKVRKLDSGCWEWTGAIVKDYGQMFHGGKHLMAHHAALILSGREPPTWPMVVDHICRNPRCVNPDHLRVVHQTDNITIYARRRTKARNYKEV